MIFECLKKARFKIRQLLIDQEVMELRHIIFCIIVLIVGPSDRHHKEFHIIQFLFSQRSGACTGKSDICPVT